MFEAVSRRFLENYWRARVNVIVIALTVMAASLGVNPCLAGPQHWGSGYPYLIAMERHDGQDVLVAYEGPLRCKDAGWIERWVDSSGSLAGLVRGGMACGDFWPGEFGTDYLAALVGDGATVTLKVLAPPEVFSTGPWTVMHTATLDVAAASIRGVCAGDLLGRKSDQVLVLAGQKIYLVAPPATPSENDWKVVEVLDVPGAMKASHIACGDFWGDGRDSLAVGQVLNTGKLAVSYYEYDGKGLSLITTDAARDVPVPEIGGLLAADFAKDGFDTLTIIPADPEMPLQVRVAPRKGPDFKTGLGPLYDGRALSRQWMPGTGGDSSTLCMTGRLEERAGLSTAFTVGRIFGYVTSPLTTAVREQHAYDPRPDAEIAFTHRFPQYSLFNGAPNFGFPLKDEAMGYEIALKNNGQESIPAGSALLKVWINTPYRNADTRRSTLGTPDYVIPVDAQLPPFDPMKPEYVKITVTTKWPYGLIPISPKAKLKKANLYEVGERWLVVQLDCKGDVNLRNNRYEAALHSYTYHPIFRENANLANRIPTVKGDPCSLEYLSRKMADAILCVWERSGTTENKDVLQRAYFDGYEIGFPDDAKDPEGRQEAWRTVQDKYEGWRELDLWWGQNQPWEKFDWSYQPELHESGHLFHPLGDLYGLVILPHEASKATMADGTPVLMSTYMWAPDLFADGTAVISLAACELEERYLVGSRGAGLERWWTCVPLSLKIRVLDRDGNPVPGAEVTAWPYSAGAPSGSGVTGPDGCWDLAPLLGEPTFDDIGMPHFYHDPENGLTDALSQIITVKIGDSYQDCAILGNEGPCPHGRHTLLYHAIVDQEGWTWDFKTNYKVGAPKPQFKTEVAVDGRKVEIRPKGTPGTTYRLYRRWEPSYIRLLIGEYKSDGEYVKITQNLAERDSTRGGRYRAIYEVTSVRDGVESLPTIFNVSGLARAYGVSAQKDGRLLVSTNCGHANPFCLLTDGESYRDYFYHYRFGHTALKVVESKLQQGRYYMTIAAADMPGDAVDYRFDLAEPVPGSRGGYDVNNSFGWFDGTRAAPDDPRAITLASQKEASEFLPGDVIEGDDFATVTRIDGATLYTDKPAFKDSSMTAVRFAAYRSAGRLGSDPESRELSQARGLATIVLEAKEYIVIADTGNGRIAVWDSDTRYVTHWEAEGLRPAAVAAHPTQEGKFFAIDRHADGRSRLYLLSFDGKKLEVDDGYPLDLDVGDNADPVELGLAAAEDADGIVLAITDASRHRVIEMRFKDRTWQQSATYDKAVGTFAGEAALRQPTDVAYTGSAGQLRLFAVDDATRLVRLR